MWNPWRGCHRISSGCQNCYIHLGDIRRGMDTSIITKTDNFNLPVKKKKNGDYKIPSGSEIATCFSSDFFIEEADEWRTEAWEMIKERNDLNFLILTKRIDRFHINLPNDWNEGYDNVTICCTVEDQKTADFRLPIYLNTPIKHKIIVCAPLLEYIDIEPYLSSEIKQVVISGESGQEARICDYGWIIKIRELCIKKNISFWYKHTGAKLIKDGQLYIIKYAFQHSQARKSGLNFTSK